MDKKTQLFDFIDRLAGITGCHVEAEAAKKAYGALNEATNVPEGILLNLYDPKVATDIGPNGAYNEALAMAEERFPYLDFPQSRENFQIAYGYDIDTMNMFVMDCLRAVHTGKAKLGGLGYDRQGKTGCVVRGKGRNVSANRRKTGDDISGYLTLGCMQNAMRTSRSAYDTLVRTLTLTEKKAKDKEHDVVGIEELEAAYAVYKHSIPSERTMRRTSRFYALPESELDTEDMLYGVHREDAERELEKSLQGFQYPESAGWFWQSENDPDLVVLKSWTKTA